MSSNDFQEERIYAFVAEAGMCHFYLGFKVSLQPYEKLYDPNPEESFYNHSAFYDERY